jgi:putative two-component system hydrogenase maturation factor HypX/HoxX
MRILLLAHAFNSLTQRFHCELSAAGHEVSVEFDIADSVTEEAVALWRPDVVIAPYLRRRIPDSVWRRYRCLVVHPGVVGDRGPSALDWAIVEGEKRWGVTVLEADGEMDAGAVWSSVEFSMRAATKGSLYRNEVTEAAVAALTTALERIGRGGSPTPLSELRGARGRWRPPMPQSVRTIDWHADDTAKILRKIRAADGAPGVADEVLGAPVFLYDAHAEENLRAEAARVEPGSVIAQRAGAILRATVDGAVWITHLKRRGSDPPTFKLPAALVLGERLAGVPERPLAPDAVVDAATWRPIEYVEEGAVGFLHFPFHNGAMGTAQCEALRAAYVAAKARPTRVIALMGGPDFWSNGIHLNLIEAADHPAEESWRNINAMNDLVREIIDTRQQITIAALRGNAGAGGVFLALAADRVFARDGVILNPHYRGMGNLYGSEYWTYLLPLRVGPEAARALAQGRLPMSAPQAAACGLIDDHFAADVAAFAAEVAARAHALAADPGFERFLGFKAARRAADEAFRPLADYRAEELERMQQNFFGFDPSYHVARYHFVSKVPRSRTPLYLARHRARQATVEPLGPRGDASRTARDKLSHAADFSASASTPSVLVR